MTNLDYLAAKYGQQLGFTEGVEEKTLNTALNILHEQGIYAMFLWLYVKPVERAPVGRGIESLFRDEMAPLQLGKGMVLWNPGGKDAALEQVRDTFTLNLKTMFLCKDLISLALTYARHAAKAR